MKKLFKNIDPATTIIPFVVILSCCLVFLIVPESSTSVLGSIRSFIDNKLGLYYLIMGLGVFFISLYIAFSKYGDIRLG